MKLRAWTLGRTLAALLGLLVIWSVLIEPRWVAARQIDVQLATPHRLSPLKVAVASDWHITQRGLWRVNTLERAQRLVREINASHPDVILLPGDFIADHDLPPELAATHEDQIAQVLGELRAPLGVYAVLGNHDWWYDGTKLANALRKRGITVLENDAQRLAKTGLWVVGIGDDSTGHSQPAQALKKLPANTHALVMMHDPASLMELPPVEGLIVAGHTHGGQVALPGIGAFIVPGRAPRQWAHGWVTHEGHRGRRMYVTSGLGVSILPIRFNMRPEWVLFSVTDSFPLNSTPTGRSTP